MCVHVPGRGGLHVCDCVCVRQAAKRLHVCDCVCVRQAAERLHAEKMAATIASGAFGSGRWLQCRDDPGSRAEHACAILRRQKFEAEQAAEAARRATAADVELAKARRRKNEQARMGRRAVWSRALTVVV